MGETLLLIIDIKRNSTFQPAELNLSAPTVVHSRGFAATCNKRRGGGGGRDKYLGASGDKYSIRKGRKCLIAYLRVNQYLFGFHNNIDAV